MNRERTDLDIDEATVWPATEGRDLASNDTPAAEAEASTIELGPGDTPIVLDPDRDDVERNAASGGWEGATEQIENDFEAEQLRRGMGRADDDETPLT